MYYDFKSSDTVQDVVLDDVSKIIDDIYDEFAHLRRYETLSVYAPTYVALDILGELIEEPGMYVDEDSETWLLHEDVIVIITISYDGGIFIEDAFDDNGNLISSESVLAYVYDELKIDDVNVLAADEGPVLTFGFNDEDECNGMCDCCNRHEKDNDIELIVNGRKITDTKEKQNYLDKAEEYLSKTVNDYLNRPSMFSLWF